MPSIASRASVVRIHDRDDASMMMDGIDAPACSSSIMSEPSERLPYTLNSLRLHTWILWNLPSVIDPITIEHQSPRVDTGIGIVDR